MTKVYTCRKAAGKIRMKLTVGGITKFTINRVVFSYQKLILSTCFVPYVYKLLQIIN